MKEEWLTRNVVSHFSFILLYRDACYVPNIHLVPHSGAVCPGIVRDSFGCHLLDHLTAHRAGLAAGQVAVVAFLQVDTDFP